MNNPSIYDYKDDEIAVARQIRRERIMEAVGAVVGVPLLVAAFAAFVLICAVA